MYVWTGSERYEQVLQRLIGASPRLATITKTLSQNDKDFCIFTRMIISWNCGQCFRHCGCYSVFNGSFPLLN